MSNPEPPGPGPGVAAVILAAGASTRFEEVGAKALAPVGSESAVRRIARIVAELGCAPRLVAVGYGGSAVEAGLRGAGVEIVRNPDWAAGRTGSIQAALPVIPAGRSALIWPVDTPFVRPRTVSVLLERSRADRVASWWTPTYGGRGGHPVVLGPAALAQLDGLPKEFPLRAAPFRGGLAEARVPVDDPGVLDNTNTPADFLRAAEAWRDRGGDG